MAKLGVILVLVSIIRISQLIQTIVPIENKQLYATGPIQINETKFIDLNTLRPLFNSYYSEKGYVALLVEETPNSIKDAYNFFANLKNPKFAITNDFFLSTFNNSGMSKFFGPTNSIWVAQKLLNETSLKYASKSSLGQKENRGGSASLYAILNAIQLNRKLVGIIMFVGQKVSDQLFESLLLREMKRKPVKMFVEWTSLDEEDKLLKNLCDATGGQLFISNYRNLSERYYDHFINTKQDNVKVSMVIQKSNLVGPRKLQFQVDSTVRAIHIEIQPGVQNGTLGIRSNIDINNDDEIADFSMYSFGHSSDRLRIVHLNTTGLTTHVGTWRLNITEASAPYSVTIFVYSRLTADVHATRKQDMVNFVELDVSDNATVRNVKFVNGTGINYNDVLYHVDHHQELKQFGNGSKKLTFQVGNMPNESVYLRVSGINGKGDDFERLSYVKPYRGHDVFPRFYLNVDISRESQLILQPGQYSDIYFNVINQGSQSLELRFSCSDEKYLLYTMYPTWKLLAPLEMVSVKINLILKKPGTYSDQITFTVHTGGAKISKKVILEVGKPTFDDREPSIDYSFSSDCRDVTVKNCEDVTWVTKITVQDKESGIQTITGFPNELYFPQNYISGSEEPITGYYFDSCCNPDIQISATDRRQNQRTISITARRVYWGPAEISAIILAILLLVVIILAIVVFRKKRARGSYFFPSTR